MSDNIHRLEATEMTGGLIIRKKKKDDMVRGRGVERHSELVKCISLGLGSLLGRPLGCIG